jgi:hypothetical protein
VAVPHHRAAQNFVAEAEEILGRWNGAVNFFWMVKDDLMDY